MTAFTRNSSMHALNAAMSVPGIALLIGHFPVVIGSLASSAALVLYLIQIYNSFEERRAKKAADTAAEIVEKASAEAAKLLDTARETAKQLAENAAKK